jgi:dTDP-4-amino-4,6-dideoxygalactose transaminase
VGEKDLNISPTSIADRITDATRAIIVVHYGGFPCDMDTILKIAGDHDLAVIEDAAHAPGAQLNGRKLGTWGVIGCFSFFSNKNLVTGEGGMVVTEDDSLAEKLRLLRSHGMTSLTWDRHRGHAWSYEVVECGYNYRIDEIRAAIGQVQLQKLEENNNRRRSLTDLYHQNLREMVPEVTIPFQKYRGLSSCHIYPLLLPGGTNRVQFMEQMKVRGIQTSIHYPPIHRFKYYRTDPNLVPSHPLPWTDEVSTREVTLPLYPTLDSAEVDFVVRSVRESLSEV